MDSNTYLQICDIVLEPILEKCHPHCMGTTCYLNIFLKSTPTTKKACLFVQACC
uniref:Uncharacterized protein n=1 Tax=Anguilla anguilla TaxID=7936 RepID=A0A0E9QAI3_ANGAN